MNKRFVFTVMFCAILTSQNAHSMLNRLLSSNISNIAMTEAPRSRICDAVKSGDLEEVQSLIESGASNIEETDNYDGLGETPLMHAARLGHLEIVKYLVDQGANVFARFNRTMPLYNAIRYGHVKIAKFFIERNPWSAMNWADRGRVASLVQEGASLDLDSAKSKKRKMSEYDINFLLGIALSERRYGAINNDRSEMVKYLLSEAKKANVKLSDRFLKRFVKETKDSKVKDVFGYYYARKKAQERNKKVISTQKADVQDRISFLLEKVFPENFQDLERSIVRVPVLELLQAETAREYERQRDFYQKSLCKIERLKKIKYKLGKKRDQLLQEKGAKAQSSNGYFGRSMYYRVWGDIDKELEEIDRKMKQGENNLKIIKQEKKDLQEILLHKKFSKFKQEQEEEDEALRPFETQGRQDEREEEEEEGEGDSFYIV